MKIRLAAPSLQTDSIVDGEGIRAVLWTQGCSHNCPGCQNPQTHSFEAGYIVDIEDIMRQIDNLEGHDGVTFSGGDPFYQPQECLEIAKYIHKKGLNIWCYTGFTYEALLTLSNKNKNIMNFLKEIDILVDGPFILEQKSLDCIFRGSPNQRIIDVKESLAEGKVCLVKKYYDLPNNKKNQRERLYI